MKILGDIPSNIQRLINFIQKRHGDCETLYGKKTWYGKPISCNTLHVSYGAIGYDIEYDGIDLHVDNELNTITVFYFDEELHIEEAVKYLAANIPQRDVEYMTGVIYDYHGSLASCDNIGLTERIYSLMEEFTDENDCPHDWWQQSYDEDDILWMVFDAQRKEN